MSCRIENTIYTILFETTNTIKTKKTYDPNHPYYSEYCKSLLTGNGSNRWFDKSVTLIVFENGVTGMNCEHSFGDAPVLGHLCEVVSIIETDYLLMPKAKITFNRFMLKDNGQKR